MNAPHNASSHMGSLFPLPLEGRTTNSGWSGSDESKVGSDMTRSCRTGSRDCSDGPVVETLPLGWLAEGGRGKVADEKEEAGNV